MIGVLPPTGHRPPTPFQQVLRDRAELAMRWLARSIEACGGAGSSAYFSRIFRFPAGWDHPYPETTGYLVPTLLAYADRTGEPRWRSLAAAQAEWVLGLQAPDGSLPGDTLRPDRPSSPSVFNTGQMVLGLVAAFDDVGDERFLDAAHAASQWLADGVDETAGIWLEHGYVAGFSPSYYTRVAWPMLELEARRPDPALRRRAVRVLDTIAGRQRPNGAIEGWGFSPGKPAFTHTVAYTLRGFLEAARLLGEEGERFEAVAERTASVLRRKADLRGRLAGTYDLELRGDHRFTCVTGSCQMAIVWLRLAERTGDARYTNTALRALERALGAQRTVALDPDVRGAVPGSSPRWGRYLFLRYPNWAAKFLVDATLVADVHLDRLLEAGPCEWR